MATDLREQLSVERERRATLEEEVKRLTSTGSSDEKYTEVWNALQSARSEILVLSNQLAEERKSREDLEGALARTQPESGAQSNTDLGETPGANSDGSPRGGRSVGHPIERGQRDDRPSQGPT